MGVTAEVCLFLFFNMVFASADTCLNMDVLPALQRDTVISSQRVVTIYKIGLMQCVKECLLIRRCRSFNFNPAFEECALNTMNTSETTSYSSAGVVASDIDLWTETLMGQCQGNTCSINEKCHVTSAGNPTCVMLDGCDTQPAISNGQVQTDGQTFWIVSEIVSFTCDADFTPVGSLICQVHGMWATANCVSM